MAARKSRLGELALSTLRAESEDGGSGEREPTIIEYVESPWGLNCRLFPVQKVILKAFYGLSLKDRGKKTVRISDWRRENFQEFTEADYLRYLFDEGRSNIREVEPGKERSRLVLPVGRRSGKCILGDSLVPTNRGFFQIKDLLSDPDLSADSSLPLQILVAQEGKRREISSHFYNGGVKDVREFTTHCGYRLGGTDKHRIKVLFPDGKVHWKRLADLEKGDVIAIHRGVDLWSSDFVDCRPYYVASGKKEVRFPEFLNEKWGLLLGCLAGDGHWTYKSSVAMTIGDSEMWTLMGELFQDLLGESKTYMDERANNTGSLQFFSVAMREVLHWLGWRWDLPRDKKGIPWSILRSPRSVVAAFLRGLFETDGCAEKNGLVVSFSTASRTLAEQVQTLLLNFGIVSRVSPKEVRGKTSWLLHTRGLRSCRKFAEEIGFLTERKMGALLGSLKSSREGGNTESIPYQRPWACRLLKSVPRGVSGTGWVRSALRASLGNAIKPSSREDLTYSRIRRSLKVAKELGSDDLEVWEHFQSLLEKDYFFDAVVKIEEKKEQVWDLTVPKGHSFVANGVVNHNTELAAWLTCYETDRLLMKYHPQSHYGISWGDEIKLCAVATGKDQAGELFAKARHYFLSCSRFDPYRIPPTATWCKFQTQYDITEFGRYGNTATPQASVKATFYACKAKGLRGPGNIVIIFDEFAHFVDKGQSSAKEVYKAVAPSTASFAPKDPNDKHVPLGPSDGKIVMISSPMGKDGYFYQKYRKGFLRTDRALCIQAPTWEVNPTIPAEEFEEHFIDDPDDFFTEFGAEFDDRSRNWLGSQKDLLECVDRTLVRITRAPSRRPHFLGLDLGVSKGGDGTAVAIGHIDQDQRITLDYLEWIRAGFGKYKDYDRLIFEEIAEWVRDLSRRFYISEGLIDHWSGLAFLQHLEKKGLKQIEMKKFSPQEKTYMYKTFKDMMWDGRLRLYNWEVGGLPPGKELCDYLQELVTLQEEKISRYVSEIEAPRGEHDDRSDALVRMVWLASQKLGNPRFLSGGPRLPGDTVPVPLRINSALKARRNALQGGSHPSRQVRRVGGR